jgi:pyruvate dehydrogenase E2 component (dihydrolipoamide acetyltransferase)
MSKEIVKVPDLGGADEVEVIEIPVKPGDLVNVDDPLLVLESDKASMEMPSPVAGRVVAIRVKTGDKIRQGQEVLEIETAAATAEPAVVAPEPAKSAAAKVETVAAPAPAVIEEPQPVTGMTENRPSGDVYAGPAVRKMAREIGLDLVMVPGSGPKGRVLKSDVKSFIKGALKNPSPAQTQAVSGSGIPSVPAVDFSKFGAITVEPLSKLHKITAANMHRSWLNVPHVTQFDDVDITELETFRSSMADEAKQAGVKLTPLPFLLKACAAALKSNPKFNASLSADGESMVFKQYVHIGIAVDTPAGLMVPVIRDVDKKSLLELARESTELAQKAKERKLKPEEMQGGCFTISSLGNMGGTGFTPIVNTPEVGILGVSRLDIKPRWNGKEFEPRKMLPLCLSYDHRAVNGADAGKFMVFLNARLSDIRRLLL